jgi:hypothetical protein
MDESKISAPDEKDKGGLGKQLSFIRDHIYNKKNDIFILNNKEIKCSSYLNEEDYKNDFLDHVKLFNKLKNKLKKLTLNDYKFNQTTNIINFSKDSENEYKKKLFIANNISVVSQISNLSSYLTQYEHQFKIQKHMGAYSFLAYLADTRNTWEHGDIEAWNRELFIESFIYGYESIWIMQKFILEKMFEEKELPSSSYVLLGNNLDISDERKKKFKDNFPTKEEYFNYYKHLYKKEKRK